ncbi:hypothetical protein OEZ85_000858 [Tetradesmus obliquus]|uniref:Uncharacterized protein n=1 Tax=Tetradesmus obliquus TaxID=3088 RepID=A0ABY8UK68_TETOB|nr:hypothetical protein OEZ85_000858 [Tetradesmus obliquus]
MSDKKVLIVFGATGTVGQALLNFVVKEAVMGEGIKGVSQAMEPVMGEGIKVVAIGTDKEKCKEVEKQFENVVAIGTDEEKCKEVEKQFENVVAIGTDDEKCKEVEKQFENVTAMAVDAKDIKQVTQVFEKHKGEGILGVVNLMGDYHYCAMEDLEDADVMTMMQDNLATSFNVLNDNLATSFNVLKVAAPALAEGGGGSIACVGAAVVHYGMKNHEAWAAAKGAVEAMHRSAAATYAASNVRINCVAAGLVESPPSSEVSKDPELGKASAELYPLKRLATPEDIAWAAAWLVHPKTTFTTGCALPVDGGLTTCQAVGLAKPAAAAAAK